MSISSIMKFKMEMKREGHLKFGVPCNFENGY